MKTFLSSKILRSSYFLLFVVLASCYVLFHALPPFVGRVDYAAVVFLLFAPRITEENFVVYSFIFGLFYDFLIDSYLGTGVLLFLFLSVLKIGSEVLFDMDKLWSRLALYAVILTVFISFNLLYFGYDISRSAFYGITSFLLNAAAYAAVYLIAGFYRAFSYAKR